MGADTLTAVRRWLTGVLLLGLAGTGVELVLLDHYEELWQLVPLVLIAVAIGALGWHLARRSVSSLRVFQWTMALCVCAGLLGVGLHFRGAAEFQTDMDPSQSRWSLTKKVMRVKAPPVLAPGVLAQLGLLGLIVSYRAEQESGM